MDCILTYHQNPLTCGVARFNKALGLSLNLPVKQLFSAEARLAQRPLLSIKLSEFSEGDAEKLGQFADDPTIWPSLRVFLHDYSGTATESKLLRRASKLYAANEALMHELSPLHNQVVQAWCPGYLFERRPFANSAEIKIYTFGMAHKMRVDYYYRLRDLLEATNKSYALYISAAIHEGTSLDQSFTAAYEELAAVFGDNVYFLGFISDCALFNYLTECTFFAAFFPHGVRANNTSVHTAMQCGAVVLTNLDDGSPPVFKHLESVIDISQCPAGLPLDESLLQTIKDNGRALAGRMGWVPLTELFARHEPELQLRLKPTVLG